MVQLGCSGTQANTCWWALFAAANLAVRHLAGVKLEPEHDSQVHTFNSSNPYAHFKEVLDKLRTDPLSITPEDARRLSEQVEVTDRRSASIVSAVESLALASQDLQQLDTQSDAPHMVHEARHTQQVLVNDLKAAVDSDPKSVTLDLLKATQEIVSSE